MHSCTPPPLPCLPHHPHQSLHPSPLSTGLSTAAELSHGRKTLCTCHTHPLILKGRDNISQTVTLWLPSVCTSLERRSMNIFSTSCSLRILRFTSEGSGRLYMYNTACSLH